MKRIYFFLLLVFSFAASFGQWSITSTGTAFTQNFDGMASSSTATLPTGFRVNGNNAAPNWSTGTTATTVAAGSTGAGVITSGSAGGTYNFANGITASATDRCLGFLTSGSYLSADAIILRITNNTGSAIASLDISFDYEKYRSGTRAFNWTFFHGSASNPTTSAAAGDQSYAADANNTTVSNPPSSISKSFTISGLSIADGTDYYLKWNLVGVGGSTNGQAIGIDNFSLTATAAAAGPADHIAFVGVPATGPLNSPITSFTVEARRADNSVDASYVSNIVITKATGPGNLTGTLTRAAVGGVATFNDLQFDAVGNYTLNANSGGFTQITSGTIAISDLTLSTDYFRSAASNSWNNLATWESSHDNSTWIAATSIPDNNANTITIRTHTVTISSNVTADQVTVDAGGQITVSLGNTLTIANGTGTDLTVNGTLLNQGTVSFAGAAVTIGSGATFIHNATTGISTPLNSVTFNAASTMIFRGSSTLTPSVSFAGRAFGHLIFESTAGAWAVTISGAAASSATNVTIGSGVNITNNYTGTFTVNGDFTNNGTLTNNSGAVIFANALADQNISGSSATTFYTLTLNKASGKKVILSGANGIGVNNVLTLVLGTLVTNANTVTLSANGTISEAAGQTVLGNLTKTRTFVSPDVFGGMGVTITSAASLGSTTVTRVTGTAINNNGQTSIKRYFDITPTTNTGLNATLDFTYDNTELNGNTAASLSLFKSPSPYISWTNMGGTVAGNTISLAGVNDFSRWTASSHQLGNNTWLGLTAGWTTGTNWSYGTPPTNNTVIIISSTATNPAVLPYNIILNGLEIQGAQTLDLGGRKLILNGPVTGTGTIKGSAAGASTSDITVTAAVGTLNFTSGFNTIRDLNIQSGSATLGTALNINGTSTPGTVTANGTLNTNDNLTLRSDAGGTARIAPSTGTINGKVTVERYIPKNSFSAFRVLSVPTNTTQTIHEAWQENQAPMANGNPGFGVLLTDSLPTWAPLGYDMQFNKPQHSLMTYDAATDAWTGGTINTSQPIATNSGYMVFIRGDRSATPVTTVASINSTTLRTKGPVYQGIQPPISVTGGQNGLIGNIYASAIDFTLITKDAGINNSYYVWDPKLANAYRQGAYQTFSSTTSWVPTPGGGSYNACCPNTVIQSGLAFFVHATTTGNVTLTEACKVKGGGVNAFAPTKIPAQFKTNLYSQDMSIADGNTVVFDNAYANKVDRDDVVKIANVSENFGIVKDGQALIIEGMQPVTSNDVINFSMSNLSQQTYVLEFVPMSMPTNVHAYLIDNYLHTTTPVALTETSTVKFTVTSEKGSSASDRFKVIFKSEVHTDIVNNSPASITINPKPITGSQATLLFTNEPKGIYNIRFVNSMGQVLFSKVISHNGGSSTQSVQLPKLVSGIYHAEIILPDNAKQVQKVIISN